MQKNFADRDGRVTKTLIEWVEKEIHTEQHDESWRG